MEPSVSVFNFDRIVEYLTQAAELGGAAGQAPALYAEEESVGEIQRLAGSLQRVLQWEGHNRYRYSYECEVLRTYARKQGISVSLPDLVQDALPPGQRDGLTRRDTDNMSDVSTGAGYSTIDSDITEDKLDDLPAIDAVKPPADKSRPHMPSHHDMTRSMVEESHPVFPDKSRSSLRYKRLSYSSAAPSANTVPAQTMVMGSPALSAFTAPPPLAHRPSAHNTEGISVKSPDGLGKVAEVGPRWPVPDLVDSSTVGGQSTVMSEVMVVGEGSKGNVGIFSRLGQKRRRKHELYGTHFTILDEDFTSEAALSDIFSDISPVSGANVKFAHPKIFHLPCNIL